MIKAGAIQMLRCIEWSGGHDIGGYCMWCGEFESKGHREGCKLNALLSEGEKEKGEGAAPRRTTDEGMYRLGLVRGKEYAVTALAKWLRDTVDDAFGDVMAECEGM